MVKPNQPITVALAAYGMSGRVFHAPLLHHHPGFHLHTVLQRNSRDASDRYPGLETVASYQDILNNEAIELVIVNTPEYLHFIMAQQALEAGKHVVVEKAFTPTSDEAQALIELAQAQGKVLSVFQNSRWHGDFLTIQEVIKKKLIGTLVNYEAHYDRYRPSVVPGQWKEEDHPGTGVLYNLGSHMIDQVLVLFGWPEAVLADLRVQRPAGKVMDNFDLTLFYNSLKVSLKSSYLVREPGPRYVLHGTAGSFVKYGADPQEAHLAAGRSPLEAGWGVESAASWGKINTQWQDLHLEGTVETIPGSYLGFYDNIHAALRQGEALAVKPEEARQVIAIIEAAHTSFEQQRKVNLPSPS